MKSGIYRILNTASGKCYIGQSVNVKRRLTKHRDMLEKGEHFNSHLQNAWNTYGAEQFSFEIVEHCPTEELDSKEVFWIKLYNSTDREHGYNVNSGGKATHDCKEETRKQISAKNSGKSRPWTEKHKRRASENWHNIHKPLSEELRAKIVQTRKDNLSLDGQNNGNAVITDAQAEQFILEMLDGVSLYEIAEREGLTRDILHNLYSNRSYRHILPDRREELKNKYANDFKEKIQKGIELYKSGMSQNQIAKTLHISRNTLRRELKAVI